MPNHIEDLKKVHVPLIYRVLGSIHAWRRARAARKVKLMICTIRAGYRDHPSCAFFTLYERADGKRSFKYERHNSGKYTPKQWEPYHTIVLPWLQGKWTNNQMVKCAQDSIKNSN